MKLLLMQNEVVDQPTVVKTVDINDDDHLKSYYDYLNCRCIDMMEITVNGHYYDIIFDDEYMMAQRPLPTLYVNDHTVIFGNVLFAKSDAYGNTIKLDDDDVERICDWLGGNKDKIKKWIKKIISSR